MTMIQNEQQHQCHPKCAGLQRYQQRSKLSVRANKKNQSFTLPALLVIIHLQHLKSVFIDAYFVGKNESKKN